MPPFLLILTAMLGANLLTVMFVSGIYLLRGVRPEDEHKKPLAIACFVMPMVFVAIGAYVYG